jgi:CheY-like chemotaxis protein
MSIFLGPSLLAVVHGIVTNHHGTITLDSTPGSGTTFTIHLPCHRAPHTDRTDTDRIPIPKGTGCLLFVDDEETLARLGKQSLEELGYEVIACTSSLEALNIFRATPTKFDAVITDQTMPQMTGEHLAKELFHIRPDLPIILCTGYSHSMTSKKAQDMGIRAFLMKPIQNQELSLTLQELLHQPNEGITSTTG